MGFSESENEKYVLIRDLAPRTPYTQGYLSLLARRGKVDAIKVGKSWHINPKSLEAYMATTDSPASVEAEKSLYISREPHAELASLSASAHSALYPPQFALPKVEPAPQPVEVAKKTTEVHSSQVQEVSRVSEPQVDSLADALDRHFKSRGRLSRFNYFAKKTVVIPWAATAVLVATLTALFLFVDGFSFGKVDAMALRIKQAVEDSQTLQGYMPGTHANEVLLLDDEGKISIYGHIETQGQIRSLAGEGMAPLVVDSTVTVENLSADYVDGFSHEEFTLAFVTERGNVTTERVFLNGGASVGGTLEVSGATKLLSYLEVYGELHALSNAIVGGALTVNDDITVGGEASFLNNVVVDGSAEVKKNFTALSAVIKRSLTVEESAYIEGNFGVGGDTSIADLEADDGDFSGDISANDAQFSGSLTVTGNASFSGVSLSGSGTSTFGGNLSVAGDGYYGGDLEVVGNLNVGSISLSTLGVTGTSTARRYLASDLGNETAAAYGFTGDTDTGVFSAGANALNFTAGGISSLQIDSSQDVTITNELFVQGTGSSTIAGNLEVSGDGYYAGDVQVDGDLVVGNLSLSELTVSGTSTARRYLASDLGGETAAAYSFSGDVDTGIYSAGPDILSFTTAGVTRFTIDASGNVQLTGTGTSTTAGNLDLAGDFNATRYDITGTGTSTNAGNVAVEGDAYFGGNVQIVGNLEVGSISLGTLGVTGTSTARRYLASDLGNETAAAYSFTGDIDTGVFSSGADTLNFTTGGVNRLTIDASGNVQLTGTGTSTAAGNLDLVGDFNATRYDITGSGTSTNAGNLSVTGAGYFGGDLQVDGDLSVGSLSLSDLSVTGTTTARRFLSSDLGNATAAAYSFVGDNDTGIFSAGADTLNFTTGGINRLSFDSSGDAAFTGNGTSTFAGSVDLAGDFNATQLYSTGAGTSTMAGNLDLAGDINATRFDITGFGTSTLAGHLSVTGNVSATGDLFVIGDSIADTVYINSYIQSDLVPFPNATYDLGTAARYWDTLYVDTINANTIAAASTSISGTINEDFTINSDNATADLEDMSLIFYRGTIVPNAVITWDSSEDHFDFNHPVVIQNDSSLSLASNATLIVQGQVNQTADIFQVASTTGDILLNVSADNRVGISTSSPGATFAVDGDALITGNTNIGGTLDVAGDVTFNGSAIFSDLRAASLNASSTTVGTLTGYGLSILPDLRASSLNSTSSNIDALTAGTITATGLSTLSDVRASTLNSTTTNVGTLTTFGPATIGTTLTATGGLSTLSDLRAATLNASSTTVGTLTGYGLSILPDLRASVLNASTTRSDTLTVIGLSTLSDARIATLNATTTNTDTLTAGDITATGDTSLQAATSTNLYTNSLGIDSEYITHLTGDGLAIVSGALSVADGSGSGLDADTLDTLDSLQFLRSDTSDNFTSGTLTFDAGTTLDVDGTFRGDGLSILADARIATLNSTSSLIGTLTTTGPATIGTTLTATGGLSTLSDLRAATLNASSTTVGTLTGYGLSILPDLRASVLNATSTNLGTLNVYGATTLVNATTTNLAITGITGSTQCLQADTNGVVTGSGVTCEASEWLDAGSYVYPDDGDYAAFPYFTATSTTATSTIAHSLAIDTDTLVVNANEGRVGIGTSNPATLLHLSASSPEFRIERTNNTNAAIYGIYPQGALSSSNVAWLTGLVANSNNFSVSTWSGTVSSQRLTIDNTGDVRIPDLNASSTLIGTLTTTGPATIGTTLTATGGLSTLSDLRAATLNATSSTLGSATIFGALTNTSGLSTLSDLRAASLNSTSSNIDSLSAGTITATGLSVLPDLRSASLNATSATIDTLTVNTSLSSTGTSTARRFLASDLGGATGAAFSFSGDPDTGIFSAGADQLNITTGGTTGFTLDSSQDVTLANELFVSGTATSTIAGALTVSGNTFVVDHNEGKVGIGTAVPFARLSVIGGTASQEGILVQDIVTDATAKTGRLKVGHYTNSEEPVTILLAHSDSTENNLYIGGFSNSENAMTHIRFLTAANNTTVDGTERMIIDSNGDVGIATSTPGGTYGEKLTVVGGAYISGLTVLPDLRAAVLNASTTRSDTLTVTGLSTLSDSRIATINATTTNTDTLTAGDVTATGDTSLQAATSTSFYTNSLGIDSEYITHLTGDGLSIVGGALSVTDGSGSNLDADTLDTLDSSQFLRSDTSDSFTSGTLTFDAGTTLDVDGLATFADARAATLNATSSNIGTLTVYGNTSLQAATTTNFAITGITGSTQCLQADTNGVVTGSGVTCEASEWLDAGSFVYPDDGDYAAFPYFTATSTTATSTIAHSLAIDTDTLVVNANEGRVGIGISNPLAPLHADQFGSNTTIARFSANAASYADFIITGQGDWDDDLNLSVVGAAGTATYTFADNRRFGIGAAMPDAAIELVPSGSDDYLYLSSASDALGDIFNVQNGGQVGIATTTPGGTYGEKLTVEGGAYITGGATTTNLAITGITGSTQCLQADTNGTVTGTGSACGSGGGEWLDGGDFVYPDDGDYAAFPYFTATSTTATSTIAHSLAIDTDTLVVNANEGRVGIGTASPAGTLHVDGNIGVGSLTLVPNRVTVVDDAASTATIALYNSNTSSVFTGIDVRDNANTRFQIGHNNNLDEAFLWTVFSDPLVFGTGNSDRGRIDSNGDWGIATSTPGGTYGEKLTVAGGAYITGGATTTSLAITGITGSTQCLQADTNGTVTGTGSACGSGGGEWLDAGAYVYPDDGDYAAFSYFTATSTTATSTIAHSLVVDTNTLVVNANEGRVGIGTASPQYPLHVEQTFTNQAGRDIYATSTATYSSNGSYLNTGLHSRLQVEGTANNTNYPGATAIYGQVIDNNSGDLTYLHGGYFETNSAGGGTVSEMYGLTSYVTTGFYDGGGTVTNAYGLYTILEDAGVGSFTTGYGLYIDNINATNDYGVYQVGAGDQNYFAGNVGIGDSNPTAALQVAGQVSGQYFTATSTTATSTIAHSLAIDTDTLVVNANENNVGINVSDPKYPLHIARHSTNSTGDRQIYVIPTYEYSANGSYVNYGIYNQINTSGSADNTSPITASANSVWANGSGALTTVRGAFNEVAISDTNDITNAYASYNLVEQFGASGSVISSAYGGFFGIDDSAAGSITTGYGIYVGDIAATNDYGLYQAGSDDINYFGGNVGIATTTPGGTYGEKLTVAGGAYITGGATTTSLAIAGITGSTQCLQADTNGTVTGTGSACGSGGGEWLDAGAYVYPDDGDYAAFPYFTATSTTATSTIAHSLAIDTDTLVVNANEGRVGIGILDPKQALHIEHSQIVFGGLGVRNTNSAGTSNGLDIADDTDTIAASFGYNNSQNSLYIWGYQADPIRIGAGGSERVRLTSSGELGISTTTPGGTYGEKLTVVGNSYTTGTSYGNSFIASAAGGYNFLNDTNTSVYSSGADTLNLITGGLAALTINSSQDVTLANELFVSGTATSTFAGGLAVDTSTLFVNANENRVGVGTTTPQSTFVADGTVELGQAGLGHILFETTALGGTPTLIGIGTTTPDADLTLVSDQTSSDTYLLTVATTSSNVINRRFTVDSDGDIKYDGSATQGADYAEAFTVEGVKISYEPGDIISLSVTEAGKVRKSASPYEESVVGVYSTRPGIIGTLADDVTDYEIDETNDIPVGILGRIPVKVTTENGPIAIGDRITTSSLLGVGMRADATGMVIGRALESYNGVGVAKIMVMVDPMWFSGNLAQLIEEGSTTSTSTSSEPTDSLNLVSGGAGSDEEEDNVPTVVDTVGEAMVNLWDVTRETIASVADSLWNVSNTVIASASKLRIFSQDDDSVTYETYDLQSGRREVTISGSAQIVHLDDISKTGARVAFDESFVSVIDENAPIKVIITPTSRLAGSLYVHEKTRYGFEVREENGESEGATFDWLVIARVRGDYDPAEDPELAPYIGDAEAENSPADEGIAESDTATTTPESEPQPEAGQPSAETATPLEPTNSTSTDSNGTGTIEPEPEIISEPLITPPVPEEEAPVTDSEPEPEPEPEPTPDPQLDVESEPESTSEPAPELEPTPAPTSESEPTA